MNAEGEVSRSRNSVCSIGIASWATASVSEEIQKLQELTRRQASELRSKDIELMMARQANQSLRAKVAELTRVAESNTGNVPSPLPTAPDGGDKVSLASTAQATDSCDKAIMCNLQADAYVQTEEPVGSETSQDLSPEGALMFSNRSSRMDDVAFTINTEDTTDALSLRHSLRRCRDGPSRESILRERLFAERFRTCQERKRCQTEERRRKDCQQKLEVCEATILRLAGEVRELRGGQGETSAKTDVRETRFEGIGSIQEGSRWSWSIEPTKAGRTIALDEVLMNFGKNLGDRADRKMGGVANDAHKELLWTALSACNRTAAENTHANASAADGVQNSQGVVHKTPVSKTCASRTQSPSGNTEIWDFL